MRQNELRDDRVRVVIDLSSVVLNAKIQFPHIFSRSRVRDGRDIIAHILAIGADSLQNENLSTELGDMLELTDSDDVASIDYVLQLLIDAVTRSVAQILPEIDFDKFIFEDWIDDDRYIAAFMPSPEYAPPWQWQVHDDVSIAKL